MRPIKMFLLPLLLLTLSCSSDDDIGDTEAIQPVPVEPIEPFDNGRIATTLLEDVNVPDALKIQLLVEINEALDEFSGIRTLEDAGFFGYHVPYVNPDSNDQEVPGVGVLVLNPVHIDDVFAPGEPEAIIFTINDANQLTASGFSYILNGNESAPPEGFSGEADQWQWNAADETWMLNAWLDGTNTSGVFTYQHSGGATN